MMYRSTRKPECRACPLRYHVEAFGLSLNSEDIREAARPIVCESVKEFYMQ